jgi:hypothetical protein
MQHLNNNDLDKRIHSFLDRKFAELDALETEERSTQFQQPAPQHRKLHWGRA